MVAVFEALMKNSRIFSAVFVGALVFNLFSSSVKAESKHDKKRGKTTIKVNPKPVEDNGGFDALKTGFGKGGKESMGDEKTRLGSQLGGSRSGFSRGGSRSLGERSRERALQSGLIKEGDGSAEHKSALEKKRSDREEKK